MKKSLVIKFIMSLSVLLSPLTESLARDTQTEEIAIPAVAEKPVLQSTGDLPTHTPTQTPVSGDARFDLSFESKTRSLLLRDAPYTLENRNAFLQMSDEDQKTYLKRRHFVLKVTNYLLRRTKLLLGPGSMMIDKMKEGYNWTMNQPLVQTATGHVKNNLNEVKDWVLNRFGVKAEEEIKNIEQPVTLLAAATEVLAGQDFDEKNEKFLSRLHHRSEMIVINVLDSVDRLMWSRPKLIVNCIELKLRIGISPVLISGLGEIIAGKKAGKIFGRSVELGVMIGINFKDKNKSKVVFELYGAIEKPRDNPTLVSILGITPKIGLMIVTEAETSLSNYAGEIYYPPVAPVFVATYPHGVVVGTNYSPPGFVFPPILADGSTLNSGSAERTFRAAPTVPTSRADVVDVLSRARTAMNKAGLSCVSLLSKFKKDDN